SACYRHFEDREALLRALARRGAAHLALRMEAAHEGAGSAEAGLHRVLRAYVGAALERPALFQALLSEGAGPSGGVREVLGAAVERWAPARRASGWAERASFALWAVAHGAAALLVTGSLKARGAERE